VRTADEPPVVDTTRPLGPEAPNFVLPRLVTGADFSG